MVVGFFVTSTDTDCSRPKHVRTFLYTNLGHIQSEVETDFLYPFLHSRLNGKKTYGGTDESVLERMPRHVSDTGSVFTQFSYDLTCQHVINCNNRSKVFPIARQSQRKSLFAKTRTVKSLLHSNFYFFIRLFNF